MTKAGKKSEPVLYKTPVPPVVKNTAPNKGFNKCGTLRAGDNFVRETGADSAAGLPSSNAPKGASFNSAGTKRAGSTRYSDYPDASTSPEAYKGGVGTGEKGGSQGQKANSMGERSSTGANS
jgi:hypothetical protein